MPNGFPVDQSHPAPEQLPQFMPSEPQPRPPLLRYLIIGIAVIVVAGAAVFLVLRLRKAPAAPAAPVANANANANVNAPIVPQVFNPTDAQKAQYGLDDNAMLEVVQTPTGPATVIVYPNRVGAPDHVPYLPSVARGARHIGAVQ